MELEVGMYVRIDGRKADSVKYNKWFMIDKIKYIDNVKSKYKYLIREDNDGYCLAVDNKMIVKASHNIIDLIEEGDYVNGFKVIEFYNIDGDGNEQEELGIPVYEDSCLDAISEYRPLSTIDIKSIVTKEQMEAMAYKVV